MKKTVLILAVCFTVLLVPTVSATVSISQPGADSGSVMKSVAFTVTVSGLSGTGQVTLTLPSGITTSEDNPKSFSSSSVSWTTMIASQSLSNVRISAYISGTGGSSTEYSNYFDVKTQPSISATVSPTSYSNPSGSSTIQLQIQNTGETSAKDVSVVLTLPSGVSLTSGSATRLISEIDTNYALSWTVSFSSPSNGATIDISVTPSNADAASLSIPISVSGGNGGNGGAPGGGNGGGGAATISEAVALGSITAGSSANAIFTREDELGIQEIIITPKDNLENVAFTVVKESAKPESVSTPPQSVYSYLTVTALNVQDANINSAKIKFKVNKTWITGNSIDPGSVKLLRYKSNAWQELTTSLLRQDSSYFYFESDTPGFSVFAVVGESIEAAACIPLLKRCVGNELQECSSDGGEWNTLEICEYGCNEETLACNEKPVACTTPGERRCIGDDLEECNPEGIWTKLETCQYGCQNNMCLPVPITDYTLIIISVVVIIAAVAGIFGYRFYKKKKEQRTFSRELASPEFSGKELFL